MSDHDDPNHVHTLACVNLEGITQAAVGVVENALERPIHYIHFYVDSKDGTVMVATDVPAELFPETIARIAGATAEGKYGIERKNGEAVQ